MKSIVWTIPVLAVGWSAGVRADPPRPVIAVFAIEDTRAEKARLSEKELVDLTDYLATRMSEGGAFKIVPGSQLRQALDEKKKESYKACFDTACQIEIGRDLAAQKTLATKIVLAGTSCLMLSTIYDLRESASERSASFEGACDSGALFGAVRDVAAKLSGTAVAKVVPPEPQITWFDQPRENGEVVDVCASWGARCGEGGASLWCKKRGFAGAVDFESSIVQRTFVQIDAKVCSPNCGGFSRIACGDQAALDARERKTFTRPMVGSHRLDICLHWGRECGQPASTAWCRQNGYARSIGWTGEAAGNEATMVLGDGKLCQPNCGAVRELVCERPR